MKKLFNQAFTCVVEGFGNYICFYEDYRWVNGVGAINYDTLGVALAEMMQYNRDSCLYDNSGNLVAYTFMCKELYVKWEINVFEELDKDEEVFKEMEIPFSEVESLLGRYEIVCFE